MKHVARAATDLRHTVVDDGALLREGCAHPAHHAPRPRLPVRLRPESIILLLLLSCKQGTVHNLVPNP